MSNHQTMKDGYKVLQPKRGERNLMKPFADLMEGEVKHEDICNTHEGGLSKLENEMFEYSKFLITLVAAIEMESSDANADGDIILRSNVVDFILEFAEKRAEVSKSLLDLTSSEAQG